MSQPQKIYELIISFTERSQAMVTVQASSEEDAINRIRADLEGQVGDLTVDNIREVAADHQMVLDLPNNTTLN